MSILHERRIPFDIAIQGWTKRAVIDGTGRPAEAGGIEAERRCDLLWLENDRRDRLAAEREARKLARLRAKADAAGLGSAYALLGQIAGKLQIPNDQAEAA